MSETKIQWTARPRVGTGAVIDPSCKHVANPLRDLRAVRCLDVTCAACWVPGYTFNGWLGCEKPPESPECDHCYAEGTTKRTGRDLWGPDKPRPVTSGPYWRNLRRWQDKARSEGQRRGVFAFSMGDVFEDRADLEVPRAEFLAMAGRAFALDLMILTKRPERVLANVPPEWLKVWPAHVWIGATAGAPGSERRLEPLAQIAAAGGRTFVSAEPLLEGGPSLAAALDAALCRRCGWRGSYSGAPGVTCSMVGTVAGGLLAGAAGGLVGAVLGGALGGLLTPNGARWCPACWMRADAGPESCALVRVGPQWVIVGGESGAGARPLSLDALDRVVEAADAFRVPLFVKQLGSRWAQAHGGALVKGAAHGQDPYRWPERYRRRDLPDAWMRGR